MSQETPEKPKLWYWESRKRWYVIINRVRHDLGSDRTAAEMRLRLLMESMLMTELSHCERTFAPAEE